LGETSAWAGLLRRGREQKEAINFEWTQSGPNRDPPETWAASLAHIALVSWSTAALRRS